MKTQRYPTHPEPVLEATGCCSGNLSRDLRAAQGTLQMSVASLQKGDFAGADFRYRWGRQFMRRVLETVLVQEKAVPVRILRQIAALAARFERLTKMIQGDDNVQLDATHYALPLPKPHVRRVK